MQHSPTFTWDTVPLLVINLDRRPDRMSAVTVELARLGRTLGDATTVTQRVSAVDDPDVGCTMSHIQCLELAIAKGWPAVAILEDDFACTHPAAFRRATDTFLETAQQRPLWIDGKGCDDVVSPPPTKWDVLMLCANVQRSTPSFAFGGSYGSVLRVRAATMSTTIAYIVNGAYLPTLRDNMRDSMHKMLLAGQPLRHMYALDVHWRSLQTRDAWFTCFPLLVTHAPPALTDDVRRKEGGWGRK